MSKKTTEVIEALLRVLAKCERLALVLLDPATLKDTGKLSRIDMNTPNDGVTKKTGVFNITIQADGTLSDVEAWAQKMDTDAILSVIDSR